jgi:hypothetical protein
MVVLSVALLSGSSWRSAGFLGVVVGLAMLLVCEAYSSRGHSHMTRIDQLLMLEWMSSPAPRLVIVGGIVAGAAVIWLASGISIHYVIIGGALLSLIAVQCVDFYFGRSASLKR